MIQAAASNAAMPAAWADRNHRPIQHLLSRASDIAKQIKEAEREFFMQQRQLENIQADSAHSFHCGITAVEEKVMQRAIALRHLIEEQKCILDQINEWADQALPQPTSAQIKDPAHQTEVQLVTMFLNDRFTCTPLDGFSASVVDLYERFARYCANNGFASVMARNFTNIVQADGRLKIVRRRIDDTTIADYWQKA